MSTFHYEPLDFDYPTFRLLRLCKGSGLDIECELFQASFVSDDIIPYEALSYAWGGTEMSATVYIDGHTLAVTENLYLALRYLRSPKADRYLWVDAICINQGNYQERGHQVKQMGSIYSQADQVLFWLGSPTDDTDALMDSLKQLEEESAGLACKHWALNDQRWAELWSSLQLGLARQHWNLASRQRSGLSTLLDRPWFNRVWILQEVANAKRALVCSGKKSISARFFALVPVLLGIEPKRHCQAVLDIMPGPSRKDSWWSQKQDLYTLLLKFSDSKASDPRDMIYALLGIASDAQDMQILRADYEKPVLQVLQEAILALFGLQQFPCYSIQGFLQNFRTMNLASLEKLARVSDSRSIVELLEQRKNEVWLTREAFEAAAGNTHHGVEVMQLLLGPDGNRHAFNDKVYLAAAANVGCGAEVLKLLVRRPEYSAVGMGVFQTAATNTGCGAEILEVLYTKQAPGLGDIRTILQKAVCNTGCGEKVVQSLLRQRKQYTLDAAAGCKGEVLDYVLRLLEDDFELTQELVNAAARNKYYGAETIKLLLQQQKEKVQINIPAIMRNMNVYTTPVVKVIELLLEKGVADFDVNAALVEGFARFPSSTCMEILLEQRGHEVIITEKVVEAAGNNREMMKLLLQHRPQGFVISSKLIIDLAKDFGGEIMELFLQQRGEQVKMTKEIVKAVLRHVSLRSLDVIPVVLRHAEERVPFTEDLVRAAASNRLCAEEVMEALFELRENQIEITEGLVLVAAGNSGDGLSVMGLLLERMKDTDIITEEVVKTAVGNTTCAKGILELLIQCKGERFVITEEVIKAALGNQYGGVDLIQFLLEAEAKSFMITEGLILELVSSFKPTLIALLIKQRGDEVVITPRVVEAATTNKWSSQDVVDLLQEQQQKCVTITEAVMEMG
jgi:hypothetical protein